MGLRGHTFVRLHGADASDAGAVVAAQQDAEVDELGHVHLHPLQHLVFEP